MGKGGLHGIKVLFSNKDTQHCVNSLSFQPDPAINNFQKDDEGFGKNFPILVAANESLEMDGEKEVRRVGWKQWIWN